ncbi:MAG: hypothetical protein JSW66_05500, partial [Phycisphaerales bacterium]
PEKTIDGSGLDENGLHSTEPKDMWMSGSEPLGAWIQYEFDKMQKLHEMWVWNSNQVFEGLFGCGFKDVTVEYSTDGAEWTALVNVPEFAKAPGTDGYAHNTTVAFAGALAKYVKLTAASNWGGLLPQSGLSEVRFFAIPVIAREPSPDSEATDVGVDATLSWRAGREAATHDIYLSTDEQAVIDGNAPVNTVTDASYSPSPLDLASTYYWRIDEVNEAETPVLWQGDIWSLSSQEYLVVDDFESYNDIPSGEEGSHLVYEVWSDGLADPSKGGSQIGYFAGTSFETDIVHGGNQSVPLFYDNTVAAHSEVAVNVADLQAGSDWTKHGIKALTLRFYGDPNNSVTEQMYVKLNGSKVRYDGDAENLKRIGWQMWYIDLTSIGVSLSHVSELAIGFERIGAFGGQGVVYLDDIRLYAHDRQLITPVEPNNANLAAHWQFDGNPLDSSGNALNGTLMGDPPPLFAAGVFGQALDTIEPEGPSYLEITGYKGILGPNPFSISAWINTTDIEGTIIGWGSTAGGTTRVEFRINADRLRCESSGNVQGDTALPNNTWIHVAVTAKAGAVIDDPDVTLYLDGRDDTRASTGSANPLEMAAGYDVAIARRHSGESRWLDALIDDVRIYDYELSDDEIAWLAGRTQPFDKPF